MKTKNQFTLTILVVTISLLFSSCKNKSQKRPDFNLYYTKNINNNYTYFIIFDDKVNVLREDSIRIEKIKCSKSSFIKDNLILDKIINSCGVYNYKNKEGFDFNDMFPFRVIDNSIFLYKIEDRSILKFDIETNVLNRIDSVKPFDFQILNNKPTVENISPNFKNIIFLKKLGVDKKFESYNVYLKNLITGSEKVIIEDLKGSKILKTSNAESLPSFNWISSSEFIYTKYDTFNNSYKCLILKYNILTNSNTFLGEISNIKETSVNYRFLKNEIGDYYLKVEKSFFKIDLENNKIFISDFNLGNNFSIVIDGNNYLLKYKNNLIDGIQSRIPLSSTFEINSDFIRIHDDKIVLMYQKRIDRPNPIWKNTCLIWSHEIKKWKEIEIEGETKILSFN
jgi:hypothetical protein